MAIANDSVYSGRPALMKSTRFEVQLGGAGPFRRPVIVIVKALREMMEVQKQLSISLHEDGIFSKMQSNSVWH
jgi:hypothetical protein